jgi:hypothetical protein
MVNNKSSSHGRSASLTMKSAVARLLYVLKYHDLENVESYLSTMNYRELDKEELLKVLCTLDAIPLEALYHAKVNLLRWYKISQNDKYGMTLETTFRERLDHQHVERLEEQWGFAP